MAYESSVDLARTLPALAGELYPEDEVIVVDNGSSDGLMELMAAEMPQARLESPGVNLGFAAAVNRGSAVAGGELIVILNPDAKPEAGWGEAIRRPLVEHPDWTAWMALVTFREGDRSLVNTLGNPVHFTGIVWAGGYGTEVGEAGSAREVPTASGACLAIRRTDWDALDGFPEDFFLYHEDVDLSVRIRSRGGRVGLEPTAVVDHNYEFGRNSAKWRWLERNRWAMNIRSYPGPLLLLLAPALLITEFALVLVSIRGGWFRQKLLSWFDLIRWMPRLLRERRALRRQRTIPASEFAAILTSRLDSPFLPPAVRSGPIAFGLDVYWRMVKSLL